MEHRKLKEFINIKTGKLDANVSSENGKYPFFTCSKDTLKIDTYSYDCECVLLAGNGDLNVKYYDGKFDAYQRTYILECKNNTISTKYLYYFMKKYIEVLRNQAIGGVIKYIKLSNINDAIIPIYNSEYQEKIVKEIEKIENIIDIRNKQLEELENITKSQFVEMFGDPVLNEKQWKKTHLGDECNIITGNTPSRNKKEYYGDFIEWIKSDNINTPSNYITQAEEYLSEEGEKVGRTINANSILMTCIAGSISCIGNVAMTDRKVAFNQQINGIETLKNNVNFMYIQFLLSKEYIQSTINMSLKGILSKGKLSELEFIFPPIELQNQFADIVKQIDKQKFESVIQSKKEMEKIQKNIYYKWGK